VYLLKLLTDLLFSVTPRIPNRRQATYADRPIWSNV